MSKSSKPPKPAISPAQHARVRQQLTDILKLLSQGQHARVAPQITQLIKKHPTLAEVNHVASGFYAQSGSRDQASYYAQRAIELDPKTAEYHSAMGILLVQSADYEQAIILLKKSLEINPNLHQSLGALGVCYMQTGQISKARKTFAQSVESLPDDPEAIMNQALLESDIANAHDAVTIMRTAIARFPDNPILHDSLSMFACYDDQLSPSEVFEIHQAFGRCVESKVRAPNSYPHSPDPDKRIRVGFVSSDFKEHSISYFIEPIFDHIDHDRFELCVYATSTYTDKTTDRLRAHTDRWKLCTNGIADTHKQIVNDRVDVLFELNGHFASNLLPLFAAKPAPVSITTIGYANTTGLSSIDARLVDAITDPPPNADTLATEQLIRVDDNFLCYRPPIDSPEIQKPDQSRPFTFGSFNDLRKMSPSTLQTWADILTQNPTTRLVLKTSRLSEPEVREDIHARFKSLGIDPSRIDLLGRTPTTKNHLDLYNQIDCSLDTFPYTGTTTTCESIWMGVPMITLMGNAHAGRVSASLLSTINREDLIAPDRQAYINLAAEHANAGAPNALSRSALRDMLTSSPLTDEPGYTRKIESIISSLWTSWCAKQESAS